MIRGILRVALTTATAVILVTLAFTGGYVVSRQLFPPPLPPDGGAPADWKADLPVFWEAWNWVQKDFYKTPLDSNDLVNGSVSGMVDSLGDPHTLFIDAKSAAIEQSTMQGSFEGIGATIEMREGRLTIVSPIKGSPAEKAGLLPDDVILQVGDTTIQNMDVNEAVRLIRGPKGTPVTLKIQRARQPVFTVTIVRDTIRTFSVESRMIPDTQIGYISLSQFTATAPQELDDALAAMLKNKPTGLILDLRQNPGGYLNAAVQVASEFLDANQTVVIVKDKNGTSQAICSDARGRPSECKTVAGGQALNVPMVLLIDKGSASASEIIAAAMKDYRRATLVGTLTYGKGSVQNVHTLSDKSELNVTVAHFFSPLNKEIDNVGVSPDVEVKITDEDITAKRDPQLNKAIELLKSR